MQSIKASITKTELTEILAKNEDIRIIDVRNPDEFNTQHIPMAENIPLNKLEEKANDFDKNQLLITTCGKGGGRSAKGAGKLRSLGFKAQWLEGGTFGWFDV